MGCETDVVVHESASTGYDRHSDVYATVRPTYHDRLVERFVERFGRGEVAEIGAGSGIFTSQLSNSGCIPIAVEPVEAMRRKLLEANPTARIQDGTAEQTGLAANSVDTVVAAQAFHWFDHEKALEEIDRILRPGGHLVCVWNVRDESIPWVAAYTEVVDRHAKSTPRYRTMDWRRAIDGDARFEAVDEWHIDNPVPTTPDGVVARALSTSFIAALDDVTQATVLDEIRSIADEVGSKFVYPYRSELQAWIKN